MAVEWTITIEGRNEFGDICRKAVRIDKSWERLSDGDLGLSIEDGKTIMTALQSAVVNHEAETYSLFRRVCPDCHRFRPVKDYTTRQIRTVFGIVEVRNPRWMICRDCYPGMVVAFAPLKEICPDRATSELMELTARLGGMMPYRQAASVLAEFLPVESTETHATVRKRTIRVGERLDGQVAREELGARAKSEERHQLEMQLPGDRRKEFVISIDTAHVRSADPNSARNDKLALLTAILAHGINLGLTRMADVSPGLTMRQLAWAHDWHIREEGYNAAHAILVNAQKQLPLTKLWGDGTTSSSDGQYFPAGGHAEAIGDLNARYGPNPGAKFYRFTSDQYGAFHIIAMNANASEAIYVLDGLLYHGSDLAIETHYVDTGGVSDISFALCHLVGFQLVPRLRGLKDRKLYLFPGDTPPENLASLVGEPINIERIKANWNDILRLVTTIRSGQVRPSTLLAKLSAFPRQNGLALALRDIGRINRSIFLPQWWQNPEMRRNATAGLNKSEAQNTLARALFFNRLGELRDRTFESQFYRASGLNLLINAIVYWNTLYLEPTFAQLNREGIATPPDVIKHITPLGWQHISLTGDYIWTPTDSPDLRPLRRETSFLAA